MMSTWLVTLVRIGAVGCGLMAGVFFAFSVAVMPGLRRLPPSSGLEAMQAINRAILNPIFLVVFMGTTLVAAALAVTALWTWDDGGGALRLAGGLTYVIGGFLLTAAYHVPRNNAIDQLDPADAGSAAKWTTYLAEWVPWNHVRALASSVSLVLLVIASRS
jgi:uncharacterized membrane protein